jgi:DNA-binding protein
VGAPLPPEVISALTTQVNVKQGEKRISKARQTALALRKLHWPDVKVEDLWLLTDGQRGGFAQVPRTLSMIMNMINDITKRKTAKAIPAGKTYLILWLHVYEEGLVRIDSEAEAAFEAGYGGQRNATTFRLHMNILKDLGFIDFRKGTKGPMQYVLLLNPYKVVQTLHADGLIPNEQYAALIERANAIGSGREFQE